MNIHGKKLEFNGLSQLQVKLYHLFDQFNLYLKGFIE